MGPKTSDNTLLTTRLDEIDRQNHKILRQNRWLRAAVIVVPAVAILAGAAANKSDIDAKTVTAEKLVIVDADGKPAVVIGVTQDKFEGRRSEGRAIVVYPDVFAIGDINELFDRDMENKAIFAKPRPGYKGHANYVASSVMLLDCAKLKH